MIERDFYWINPQSVVIPKGKLTCTMDSISSEQAIMKENNNRLALKCVLKDRSNRRFSFMCLILKERSIHSYVSIFQGIIQQIENHFPEEPFSNSWPLWAYCEPKGKKAHAHFNSGQRKENWFWKMMFSLGPLIKKKFNRSWSSCRCVLKDITICWSTFSLLNSGPLRENLETRGVSITGTATASSLTGDREPVVSQEK